MAREEVLELEEVLQDIPGLGDARGTRTRAFFGSIQTSSNNQCLPVAGQFLDTPGTGTHTYKLQVGGESGVGTLTVQFESK